MRNGDPGKPCGKCKKPAYHWLARVVESRYPGGQSRESLAEVRNRGTMSITIRLGKTQHTMVLCGACAGVTMDTLSTFASPEQHETIVAAWAEDLNAKPKPPPSKHNHGPRQRAVNCPACTEKEKARTPVEVDPDDDTEGGAT